MKRMNDCLNRLLRAAAKAPPRDLPAFGWAAETRVLAAWREGRQGVEDVVLFRVLRQGLVCAFALTLLSLTLALSQRGSESVWSDPSTVVNLVYTR
jgi:hypothetical protein